MQRRNVASLPNNRTLSIHLKGQKYPKSRKSSSVKLEAINFYGEGGGVNELEKVDILKLLKADILKLR